MSNLNNVDEQAQINIVFSQFNTQDIEQFYTAYKRWTLQQRIIALQTEISDLKQQIDTNSKQMQDIHPSAITLAALARVQASGVSDIDLLDRMFERGEAWLDHTMHLLERCENLDIIHNDYTSWCELALEGAYDWIASVNETGMTTSSHELIDEAVEAQLFQKLQEEDETEKASVEKDVPLTPSSAENGAMAADTEIRSKQETQVRLEDDSELTISSTHPVVFTAYQEHTSGEVGQVAQPRKRRGFLWRLLAGTLGIGKRRSIAG